MHHYNLVNRRKPLMLLLTMWTLVILNSWIVNVDNIDIVDSTVGLSFTDSSCWSDVRTTGYQPKWHNKMFLVHSVKLSFNSIKACSLSQSEWKYENIKIHLQLYFFPKLSLECNRPQLNIIFRFYLNMAHFYHLVRNVTPTYTKHRVIAHQWNQG